MIDAVAATAAVRAQGRGRDVGELPSRLSGSATSGWAVMGGLLTVVGEMLPSRTARTVTKDWRGGRDA
jgi:hypothetical protein